MSTSKETPEGKMSLETRILVCLEGKMHVEVQQHTATAERKNLGTYISY